MKAAETKHCSCPDCRGSVMNECSQAAVERGNRAERERLLAENRELLETRQYLEREIQTLGRCVAAKTVGPEDRRPDTPPTCYECGGNHEPSGARSDCIRHWKLRAIMAENAINVVKSYGVDAEGVYP